MLNAGHDLSFCRAVACQLIGDHNAWRSHLLLQQLAQQPLGRLLVASALDQNIEHDPGLVDGAPQPVLHPGDLEHDFIEMPFVANAREPTTDPIGELLAKFARPLPHGFVADNNAARGEQLVHHAKTERKAEIQPHGMSDDLDREAISGIAGAGGCRHPTRLLIPIRRRKYPRATKLTVPLKGAGLRSERLRASYWADELVQNAGAAWGRCAIRDVDPAIRASGRGHGGFSRL